jgi:hypothetical protein
MEEERIKNILAFLDMHRLSLEGFRTARNPFDLILRFVDGVRLDNVGPKYLKRSYDDWVNDLVPTGFGKWG